MNLLVRSEKSSASQEVGQTLIEMMVVLALIGLVMSIVAFNVMEVWQGARVDAAHLKMDTLEVSLDHYELKYGKRPSTSEGLTALVAPPPRKDGTRPKGFVKSEEQITDPWKTPFGYESPATGHEYEITSLGKDGLPGGDGYAADLSNWDR